MKLDRNINDDGLGKYALINLRKLKGERWTPVVARALDTLCDAGVLEWGRVGDPDEFFLIKLKDQYAANALLSYQAAAYKDDPEWAEEVKKMALRSGPYHPLCKNPD